MLYQNNFSSHTFLVYGKDKSIETLQDVVKHLEQEHEYVRHHQGTVVSLHHGWMTCNLTLKHENFRNFVNALSSSIMTHLTIRPCFTFEEITTIQEFSARRTFYSEGWWFRYCKKNLMTFLNLCKSIAIS